MNTERDYVAVLAGGGDDRRRSAVSSFMYLSADGSL